MLILGRRVGEEIIIDNNICVKVVRITNKIAEILIKSDLKFSWVHNGICMNTNNLTRDLKVDEVIIINDNIKIMLTKIVGKRLRLGFETPKNIKIVRKEIDNEQIVGKCIV